jgi:hypothetical protein
VEGIGIHPPRGLDAEAHGRTVAAAPASEP